MTDLAGFIWDHRLDDPGQLALSGKKWPQWPMSEVARQVEALQKIRHKAPAWYQPGILFPPLLSLEQASSEATARFKANLVHGSKLADLTCGLGIDAWAFAQKITQVDAVEQSEALAEIARHNFQHLNVSNIQVFHDEAANWLSTDAGSYDWIFVDPARRDRQNSKVFNWSDCSPDLIALKELLFRRTRQVLIKAAPMLDIRLGATQLGGISRIWIVEVAGEVKEVLYAWTGSPLPYDLTPQTAVSLSADGKVLSTFEFDRQSESNAALRIADVGQYLYEPASALMKAGVFKLIAQRWGLGKLQANTHLYTADHLQADFWGKKFKVEALEKYDKAAVARWCGSGKAHVVSRNFPETSETVRKKLGLIPGGDQYVFAATVADEKRRLILCRLVE